MTSLLYIPKKHRLEFMSWKVSSNSSICECLFHYDLAHVECYNLRRRISSASNKIEVYSSVYYQSVYDKFLFCIFIPSSPSTIPSHYAFFPFVLNFCPANSYFHKCLYMCQGKIYSIASYNAYILIYVYINYISFI